MRCYVVVHIAGQKPQHYPDVDEEQLENIRSTYPSADIQVKEIDGLSKADIIEKDSKRKKTVKPE